MHMNWKRWAWCLAGACLLAAVVWVLRPAPVWVDGVSVQTGHMQVTVDDLGETRSHDRFTLSAPVSGRLERMTLRDGDAVQDKQLLARIAPLPLSERERKELTARVAAAQAMQLEAQQRVQQSAIDQSQAQRELQRMRQLEREGFIAPQGLEQAMQKETAAGAALEGAQGLGLPDPVNVFLALLAGGATDALGGMLMPRGSNLLTPTAGRVVRAVGAPAVELAFTNPFDMHMPEIGRASCRERVSSPV